MIRLLSRASALLLALAPAARLCAQQAPSPAPRFSLDVGTFYQALDNGYGDWQGGDVRLAYSSPRFSPFIGIGTQHREAGSQQNFGVGSYLTWSPHFYSIVGVSGSSGGSVVLFPRLRWDVSLMADSRVVPGLVIATGYTHLSFGGGSTGQIASIGPIYYHGPMVLTGSLHLNHDGVGGANSGSGNVGGQYGAQGKYWVGGGMGFGREAYQLISDVPFDVRFTDVSASLFYQRWMTARTALTARFDYEHKLTAYQRRGLSLSYHVDF